MSGARGAKWGKRGRGKWVKRGKWGKRGQCVKVRFHIGHSIHCRTICRIEQILTEPISGSSATKIARLCLLSVLIVRFLRPRLQCRWQAETFHGSGASGRTPGSLIFRCTNSLAFQMAAFGETRGLGGEIKLFPPPQYSGETEKWEDWSWQLKSYVALYKPIAGEVMNTIEGVDRACTDQVVTDFEDRGNCHINCWSSVGNCVICWPRSLNDQRQIERSSKGKSWRQLHARCALPDRARGVSLLSQLLVFKLRDDHCESDLTEFVSLKSDMRRPPADHHRMICWSPRWRTRLKVHCSSS